MLTAKRKICSIRTTLLLSIPTQPNSTPLHVENRKDLQQYSIGKVQSNLLNTKYHVTTDPQLSMFENQFTSCITKEVVTFIVDLSFGSNKTEIKMVFDLETI